MIFPNNLSHRYRVLINLLSRHVIYPLVLKQPLQHTTVQKQPNLSRKMPRRLHSPVQVVHSVNPHHLIVLTYPIPQKQPRRRNKRQWHYQHCRQLNDPHNCSVKMIVETCVLNAINRQTYHKVYQPNYRLTPNLDQNAKTTE
jgi:hypothetical protein